MTVIVAIILLFFQQYFHQYAQASSLLLTKKPIDINTSTFATNSDLPIKTINTLLEKCSNKSLEECDMCSLCQNGAFCRQKSKRPSLFTSTPKLMTTINQFSNNPYNSLAYLRSQIDFTCYCVPGYTGTYCQIDINECLSSPCSNNATCIDLINAYECRCPSGYTGENCEININECDSSPCNPMGGQCVDLIDGYYCDCTPGFTGPTCSVNIDECVSQPCLNNATCIDKINGFECSCNNTGFNGLLCENNIDDCLNVNCKHDSVCIDGINSFKCECHPGYDGKLCEIDIDECLSSPCVYGKCWQNSDRQSLARKYLLSNGSSSIEKFDEQIFEISLKIKFNYSNSAGYWCECEPGYTGTYCELKIDECQSSPCGPNGRCIDLINGYKCVCHPGYTGRTCTQNIDECELYSPCAENTVCVDLVPDYSNFVSLPSANGPNLNGYFCDCTNLNNQLFKKNGNRDVIYAGQNCTLKLNACQNLKTKCQHGSECQSILFNSTEQDIMCICKPGYTGKYCQYSTVFRMDGTYFVREKIESLNDSFSIHFEFKINFFDRISYPLIYFDHVTKLLFEFELYRDHIEIRNDLHGMNNKIGFLYQEFDESYFNLWNLLQIKITNKFLIVTYSIKQIQLNVTKFIDLRKYAEISGIMPTSFTVGKYFNSKYELLYGSDEKFAQNFATNSLLSDVCFRDFYSNGDVVFKSFKADFLNHGLDQNNKVKFGCNLHNLDNQCKNEAKSYLEKGSYCENNSTCVNRWFNYECKNCFLPFFGKNCNYGENYGVIKRRLSTKSPSSSYITYFFDFDPESQENLKAKFGPLLTPNETLAFINVSKQRRIALLEDIDFYSISFDLSLSQQLTASLNTKTNLFTLNSLDDLTSNKIFLFGVNLHINQKKDLSDYNFEIFTRKQSIKSETIKLNKLTNVNLTFTFNSIELRLNHNTSYLIRLTDKYFDLFIRLLLKAYGSFQLNVNREEELLAKTQSHLTSCISNLKLLTVKSTEKTTFSVYDLIGQTKSIVMSKNGPNFDSTCDFEPLNSKKEMLDYDLVPENCFLVNEFDVIENRNTKSSFDCQCDSIGTDCSYNFWSGFENQNRFTNGKNLENEEEFHGCAESSEYACFNNGTCVDNYYADSTDKRANYRCLCRDSYTGKRCERFDPCLKSLCSINSTCEPKLIENDQISYECKCFPGFLGRNCNIKLDQTCLGKPCMNGATCINITSYEEESLSYECMCPLGYEGKRCDKKIDYCFLYEPCKNGAVCSNKEMHNSELYECKCAEGWKGVNCTIDIDECADMKRQKISQCSDNGYCINIPGSYKCKCSDLYFGKDCELVHICQENEPPCQNGGICIVVGNIEENRYSCRCPIGFTGINCSFETCDSNPCQHDSVCSMENESSFKCNCTKTGFAGPRCQNLINHAECRQQTCFGNMTCDVNKCDCNSIDCEKIFLQMKSRPREIVYHLVIWPLLVIMVSLLIILFSIFAMRIKKGRATRGTYSPSRHEQQASRIEFNMDLKIPPEERLI